MANGSKSVLKYLPFGLKLLPLLAFIPPLLLLYFIEPASFELMWKGRTFQLFFIWLIGLELILGWEELNGTKIKRLFSKRTISLCFSLLFPTIYVISSFYGGLNNALVDWAASSGIKWASSIPLSTEYLVFTAFFCAIIVVNLGIKGLKAYSVPAIFLGLVGILYTIDNVFPYGQFTPFQIFVPTTTVLAASLMNLMGYTTSITYNENPLQGNMPHLSVLNPSNPSQPLTTFAIAWPCAGIESFLIFTVVILLFLKRMKISWRAKIGYFAIGAAITYFINSLRIVNIFMAGMAYGETSAEVQMIHFYYGPLYAISWIIVYPLLIIGSRKILHKFRNRNSDEKRKKLGYFNPLG